MDGSGEATSLVTLRVRPRFEVKSDMTLSAIEARLNSALEKENAPCLGKIKNGYGTLYLPVSEQHYWSPQVTISIEDHEDHRLIRGVYGPRAAVWTMFIFLYALLSLATLMVSIVGYTNYYLGRSASISYLAIGFVSAILILYVFAQAGQKMGRSQTLTLHQFIEDALAMTTC